MVNAIINRVVGLLPAKVQPYAKAVVPSVVTIVTVLVEWAATGQFNGPEISTAAVGAVGALVTFLVPNVTPKA